MYWNFLFRFYLCVFRYIAKMLFVILIEKLGMFLLIFFKSLIFFR